MYLIVLAALAGLAATPANAPAPIAAPSPAPAPAVEAASSVVAAPTPRNSWVIVAADATGGAAYDAGSIRRAPDGNSAQIATLFATKAPMSRDGAPVHFLVANNEYDCTQPRRREGAVLGLDASGKPVASEETVGEWQAVEPKSTEAGFQALACKGATPDAKLAEGPLKDIVAEFQKRFAK
ncbi:surface-adhesin E family protein [Caulobacter sp. 17J65-9]|uniref:surface-adhesin E family protein n=1 Tax=Caulobacter sp. 17J65-9 TaxID=2709382 RepID=UPI0013CDB8A6|nr:surface-adhesin E family protein [Caulobacter sp. 17J65-9]NEX91656.1 hypothetical protein [Caulobacter sp. 17J65-9]